MSALLPGRVPRHLRRRPGPVTAARWAAHWIRGTTSVALRYPFEVVPPTRRSVSAASGGRPPALDRDWPGDLTTVQRVDAGVGPLFHRVYWIDVVGAELGPAELITRLLQDVNTVTPDAIGSFLDGDRMPVQDLHVGDEFLVALPGPWSAPVRVVDITDHGFTLATLSGHIEAGQIEFRAVRSPDRAALRFEIESWARSSAALLHLLYDVVPVIRELQLVMWSRMCRNIADLVGGTAPQDVQVSTQRHPWPPMDES